MTIVQEAACRQEFGRRGWHWGAASIEKDNKKIGNMEKNG
jgi:hypothetical protein